MEEQDLLRKVGALLAKAEGTDNKNEADSFFAKAKELMLRYAIDEARVRSEYQARHGRPMDEPTVEDYMFSSYAHHAAAKQDLLVSIGSHQSVRVFPYSNRKYSNAERVRAAGGEALHESQWARLVGYKTDIEATKMLYLSLLIQSQKFAADDWRERYGEGKYSDDGVGKFTWVTAHMEGFARRIEERFKELTATIYAEVADGNALILDKDANIQEWMYEHGIMSRPREYVWKCWTPQPESDPDWPRTKAGKPNKKHRALYCLIPLPASDIPHEGPHEFTYDTGTQRYSTYVTKGRRTSYEGRHAGTNAANRADIGLSRVGSNRSALGGGR